MKVIVGAGGRKIDGWVSTEQSQLDLLCREDFERVLNGAIGFENILAEHLFEHIDLEDQQNAFNNCYEYLSIGGKLRVAVPDGNHSDPAYIDYVRPGGIGAGASDHKILFTYSKLASYMLCAGFVVTPLEWWDSEKQFHCKPWNEIDGYIERCLANDPRNKDGKPHYTSLIVDGIKKADINRPNLVAAFDFVENHDPNRVSPFNRKKTTTFYELARIAPPHGVIVELGAYHGIGTAALWYGARDGHRCEVISIDAYKDIRGWAGEPYGANDREVWLKNISEEKIHPQLRCGDAHELSQTWDTPISLIIHDLGCKKRMPQDVLDWEQHVMVGGLFALRDIDDYSMGTEEAVRNLMSTGRWGKRRNWEAFITSLERIA